MPQKQPKADLKDENENVETLRKEINALPDDSSSSEGKIRDLHGRILDIKSDVSKKQLLTELKASSYKGLSQELGQMVKEDGLIMESLTLVLKYLTKKNELAEYLFLTPSDVVEEDGLDPIRRRLGPKLEVLGGLLSVGIDVDQDWVAELIKKAPSRKVLARISIEHLDDVCSGATNREMEDVSKIVREAEWQSVEKPNDEQKQASAEGADSSNKAIDKEKLEEAKALMNDAKKMAKEESEAAKKAVKEKMSEISKLLQLPSDWNKNENEKTPDALLKELDGMIGLFNNVVEPNEPYKSDHEVVQKASGSRALCGIYFSKYRASTTSERPLIIMPPKVMLSSPNNSHQIRYIKFSESRAAANYVQTVKSSSTNVGFSVGGFYGLFVGEVSGGYGSSHEETSQSSRKTTTSHASVVQYIWTACKTFRIEQEQFILSVSARKHAKMLAKAITDEQKQMPTEDEGKRRSTEIAKSFLQRYGSHLPAGLHTLGGILFRIVDAQSEGEISTYKLTEKSAQQLQTQLSFGFLGGAFGIGGSVSAEHTSGEGKMSAEEEKEEKISYTFSSQAMGPPATDPATFMKLLQNNSTWALIDRGSPEAYIPVWEMIEDLGTEFKAAAEVLRRVWSEKEKRLKKESRRIGKQLAKIVEKDVEIRTKKSLEKDLDKVTFGYLPENGAQLIDNTISMINLSREEAFAIAQDNVNTDPRYRVSAVSLCSDGKFMVRSWLASEDAEMTFESKKGVHELIYSEIIFKWKSNIPKK